MPIITIASTKGGVGKSTFAINLITQLTKKGEKVVLLDADPQGSSIKWHSVREMVVEAGEELIEVFVASAQGKALIDIAVEKSNKGYLVFIDSVGANSKNTREALIKSDFVLTLSGPSPLDIWEIESIIKLVKSLSAVQKRKIPVMLALNKVHPNLRDLSDIEAFMETNLIFPDYIFSSIIRERMSFQHALREGKAVCEYTDKKALAEFDELATELLEHINS